MKKLGRKKLTRLQLEVEGLINSRDRIPSSRVLADTIVDLVERTVLGKRKPAKRGEAKPWGTQFGVPQAVAEEAQSQRERWRAKDRQGVEGRGRRGERVMPVDGDDLSRIGDLEHPPVPPWALGVIKGTTRHGNLIVDWEGLGPRRGIAEDRVVPFEGDEAAQRWRASLKVGDQVDCCFGTSPAGGQEWAPHEIEHVGKNGVTVRCPNGTTGGYIWAQVRPYDETRHSHSHDVGPGLLGDEDGFVLGEG